MSYTARESRWEQVALAAPPPCVKLAAVTSTMSAGPSYDRKNQQSANGRCGGMRRRFSAVGCERSSESGGNSPFRNGQVAGEYRQNCNVIDRLGPAVECRVWGRCVCTNAWGALTRGGGRWLSVDDSRRAGGVSGSAHPCLGKWRPSAPSVVLADRNASARSAGPLHHGRKT